MNYKSVITKYNEMHCRSSIEDIISIWNRSKSDLNVYVHSPFCPSVCKFCYYKGRKFSFEKNLNLYDKYYYTYLPKVIKPFLPVIESRQIKNYFFGGGTPSLMKPETMRFIFDIFPGFNDVKSKTFEIHPAVWTDEQLDILSERNFNCCIIGIQSFDKSVLARQNRLYASKEKIKELARKIKDRGMYLAVDLIYRLDPIDADTIFKRDLDCVLELNSDIISLQHNFDELKEEEQIRKFFDIISESSLAADYYWEFATQEHPEMSISKKKENKASRYLANNLSYETYSTDIFTFIDSLDECSKQFFRSNCSTSAIGFGSYQNSRKNTFSSIYYENSAFEYIEVNNNWTPEYYITFAEDRGKILAETAALMKKFNSLGNRPPEISVKVINAIVPKDDRYVFRKPYVVVGLKVSWEERTAAVNEFLGVLGNTFQHITERKSSVIIRNNH
jgi:hypothetical protein